MNAKKEFVKIICSHGKSGLETAWTYCVECAKFNDGEHPERPCLGKPFDYVIHDGNPPCKNYSFEDAAICPHCGQTR